MTTAYTPILQLALPVTGELSGTWGNVFNDSITSMVEQSIAGMATINTWAANSHTLTVANGASDEARCALLLIDDDGAGQPSGAAEVICPAQTKLYVVKNICGQTVTIKTASGSGVAVPNNETYFVFCDGTNVNLAITKVSGLTATLSVANGGTGATTLTGILKGNGTSAFTAAAANTDYLVPALADTAVTGFKTATFNSQLDIATTSGAITVNWTNAQCQRQAEPTGSITYTFTAPPGPCHLQLLINSDGTSTAQTFIWPGTVIWLGATWSAVANKKSVINFWYDGTNYYALGSDQV